MASDVHRFDVVVVGAGSGLTAAYHAGKDGKSVAVVEARPDAFGGTCVNRGCIPTKGLIQSAEVMRAIRAADRFGIHVDQDSVRADFAAIMNAIRERRTASAKSVEDWVRSSFTPFLGRARFVGDKMLEMDDGNRLRGDKIFLATGARPVIPDIPGLGGSGYWTNETVLEQSEQPRRLAIIGGGYIGCEFGHFFAALGTDVTVIDRSGCLPREDRDVRELFTREFRKRVRLLSDVRVREVQPSDGHQCVSVAASGGAVETVRADAILVATGRRPETEPLALTATDVATDESGWIHVDDRLCTTHPDIYAYGDVIGRAMFKHTSSYEGEIAYRNSQGADLRATYDANPHAVFSDPQIAAVGLTEQECEERGLRYRTARADYDDVAKGRILGTPPGLAKLIVEDGTDRILGMHVVGPSAAELIHEVVVAMNAGGGTAGLIRETIHVHPTMSELIRQVFDDAAPETSSS